MFGGQNLEESAVLFSPSSKLNELVKLCKYDVRLYLFSKEISCALVCFVEIDELVLLSKINSRLKVSGKERSSSDYYQLNARSASLAKQLTGGKARPQMWDEFSLYKRSSARFLMTHGM